MNNLFTPIGLVLVIAGLVMIIMNGFTYKTQEKVLDVGPLEVTAEQEKHVPFSPIAGGAVLVGGAILIFAGTRKN